VLRVCADPNNLPFSNVRGEGFENELTRIIAADMGVGVQYT
jgi:mxaJ protein